MAGVRHEARRLMLAEGKNASSAAHAVGYESAQQFTREYARMFGMPPVRDVTAQMTTQMRAQVRMHAGA